MGQVSDISICIDLLQQTIVMKHWPWIQILIAFIPAIAGVCVGVFQAMKAIKESQSRIEEERKVKESLFKVIQSVDYVMGFMASEIGAVHPCSDVIVEGWFDVHSGMRTGLLRAWIAKKECALDAVSPDEKEEWMLRWLNLWEMSISQSIHNVNRGHELVKPFNADLYFIEDRLRNRWGITQLKDTDRLSSRKLAEVVMTSFQGILDRLLIMDMALRKEGYAIARARCSSLMKEKYPSATGIDLIFRGS